MAQAGIETLMSVEVACAIAEQVQKATQGQGVTNSHF
jgi:hypothetical protein